MASVKYTLKDFEAEIKKIGTKSSQGLFSDIKKYLQRNSEDNVKHYAADLKKAIDTKAGDGMSENAKMFLNQLLTHGRESNTAIDPKTGATKVYVEHMTQKHGINEIKAHVHQSTPNKDPESTIDQMFKSGRQNKVPGQEATMSQMQHGDQATRAGKDDFAKTYTSGIAENQRKVEQQLKEVKERYEGKISQLTQEKQKIENELRRQEGIFKADLRNKDDQLKTKSRENEEMYVRLKSFGGLEKAYSEQCCTADYQTKRIKELETNLAKACKEAVGRKEELERHADENARQKSKLSEEMHRLHAENKGLKSRVSELAGAKLMDNNPNIADLSDPNRALKLGEKFSSLYDDDWTDAFQTCTEKFKMKEDDAIQQLLHVLLKTYEFCRKIADEQMDCLCNVFDNPCQDIPKVLTMKPQKEKAQMTQKQRKDLKDLRKQITLQKTDSITKQYLSKEYEEVKKGDKKQKFVFDDTRRYYEKCVEVCWPMVLHDPPVRMDPAIEHGVKIDQNRFRLYCGNGDILEYLVWPPLLVEGGGLLAKGVAKPKKAQREVKKK